jgi:hypothetical protein
MGPHRELRTASSDPQFLVVVALHDHRAWLQGTDDVRDQSARSHNHPIGGAGDRRLDLDCEIEVRTRDPKFITSYVQSDTRQDRQGATATGYSPSGRRQSIEKDITFAAKLHPSPSLHLLNLNSIGVTVIRAVNCGEP